MMESAITEGKEVLLMGDLNISLLHSSPNAGTMESLSNEMNLTQMIRDPTRVTQDSATLIDHIYVSDPQFYSDCGCVDVGVSDHFMVFVNRHRETVSGHKFRMGRTFKNYNIDNLLDDLKGADWKVDSEDVDLNWNHWKRIFTGILDITPQWFAVVSTKMPSPGLTRIYVRKLMRRRYRLRVVTAVYGRATGVYETRSQQP